MDAVKFDAYEDKFFTIEDIYALPEDQYAELIDGELYMMATPSMIHQRIVMEFRDCFSCEQTERLWKKAFYVSYCLCQGILDC